MNQPVNFRSKFSWPSEILAVIPKATDTKELSLLYTLNSEMIESSKELKDAFVAKKALLYPKDRPVDAETRPYKSCTY